MRFALFPFGSRGDVQPIIALGQTLRARGHEVVVGTAATFAPSVTDAGLAFSAVGGDFEGFMRTVGEELAHSPRRLLRALLAYMEEDVPKAFAATMEASRGADLVAGASLQQAAPSVAAHLGIPFRAIVFCPQTLPSSSWPPLNVRFMNMPGFMNRAAWWSVAFTMNRMLRAPVNAQRAKLSAQLGPVDDVIAHLRTSRPIVCADPGLGALPPEAAAPEAGGPLLTGALIVDVDGAPPLAPELEAFLAAGPAPVYAGFGSMAGRRAEAVTDALLDVAGERGERLILAGGWGGIARPRPGDARAPPERVLFLTGAPHTRLFPRCRLVVHHGGAGTTTAAARAGVPQLVVPHAADQFYWGERVRALGIGAAPLLRARLGAAPLRAHLAEALDDTPHAAAMRMRAQALAAELARVDGNALTADALERDARP